MRIMIKGGVWKNTEDEILKAAVMKYGKNQWARISSLLVRKSAKQCKARWYEWLDPSIKKTEWTREEDEKLLHLARLMPTQWRTIAPIVGRTPSQCLERYEKLLDAACAKDENYEANEDPRKLRPGEIDPNPESKPARPDPVDMDEDEKEMLSEARARLANTRGKKAKRKAREKQLEEARRLASLQKRRELKAAGIQTRLRRRKRRGIDYNAEIPFEKRPPPGFYDTADEDRPVEQPKFPTTIEELEGKRRADVEAQLRKQDVAMNKIAQRQDAPSAIMQANKLNDPEAIRKRARLMLPPPQITDHELEEIAKMGYASDMLSGDDFAEGSTATRALLANYSQTPQRGLTPFRTPQRTPGGNVDTVMMEAENLAKLRESQTPLLGGENPELHPSDFSGVTPKRREIRTPNPMATPLMTPGAMGLTPRGGMTPSSGGYTGGMTPRGTPFRDELHINEEMDMQEGPKLELHRQAEIRQNLRSGLTGLPLPKNEYQIVRKPIPEENEEVEEQIEEDMSDRIARDRAEEQAKQEALLRKRSKVLQRELPRPPVASLDLLRSLLIKGGEDKSSFVPPTLFEQADELINRELLALLQYDNAKYPPDENTDKEKKKGSKRASNAKSAVYIPDIEDFDEGELKEADSYIKEEIEFLRVAMGHEEEALDDFVKARDACQDDLMFFPARRTYGLASVASNSEKLEALQNEFENLKNRLDEEAKKASKSEQKAKILTHGYQLRAGKLWSQIEATFKQMDTAGTELECFQALQRQERLAATYRVKYLTNEVNKQRELERTLQRRYGDLLTEYERTQKLVQALFVELQKQEEIRAKREAEEKKMQALAISQEQEKKMQALAISQEQEMAEAVCQEQEKNSLLVVDAQEMPEVASIEDLPGNNMQDANTFSEEQVMPEALENPRVNDTTNMQDANSLSEEREMPEAHADSPVSDITKMQDANSLSEGREMPEAHADPPVSDITKMQDANSLSEERKMPEALENPRVNDTIEMQDANGLSEEREVREDLADHPVRDITKMQDANSLSEEQEMLEAHADPPVSDITKMQDANSLSEEQKMPEALENPRVNVTIEMQDANGLSEEQEVREDLADHPVRDITKMQDANSLSEEHEIPEAPDNPPDTVSSNSPVHKELEKHIDSIDISLEEEIKPQESVSADSAQNILEAITSRSCDEEREIKKEGITSSYHPPEGSVGSNSLPVHEEKQEDVTLETPHLQNEKQEVISSHDLSDNQNQEEGFFSGSHPIEEQDGTHPDNS